MLDLLLTQNHKVKLLNMELTKEEMKKVIGWLDHYYDRTYGSHDSPMNLDDLPTINNKFKTYFKGGENNE